MNWNAPRTVEKRFQKFEKRANLFQFESSDWLYWEKSNRPEMNKQLNQNVSLLKRRCNETNWIKRQEIVNKKDYRDKSN